MLFAEHWPVAERVLNFDRCRTACPIFIQTCDLIEPMTRITEAEFARICDGIAADRESIIRHNPIGTPEITLLWMLLSVLISYLSLTEIETPCFTGMPTAETYRQAIQFVIEARRAEDFDVGPYLDKLGRL